MCSCNSCTGVSAHGKTVLAGRARCAVSLSCSAFAATSCLPKPGRARSLIMRPRAADMRPRHRRPAPPPDEFCPEVPLMWKRQLRKAPRLPRLDKMRLTTASERLLQRKRLPKGQWWESIAALLPSEAVSASTPMQKQISSKASSVGDDSCRSDMQAAVARSLLADIMVAQAESEGNDAATWTDVDLDLNFGDLHSADVSHVVAQVFVTQLTTPSPDSGKHSAGSVRELARSPDDGLHSEIAQELAYQIVARPSTRQSETVEASLSAVSPALALVSSMALDRACSAGSQIASEDEGDARIARDAVTIAGEPHQRPPRLSSWQHELSDANTESIAARSVARQAIAPLMHELRGYREHEPQSADSSPGAAGDLEMAALIQDTVASTMARGITLTPEPASLHGGDESHHDSNLNTESLVANSIVRQAVLPHLAESAAGNPAQSSHTAGVEEVTGADAVARDLVTSASRQHADESRSATPHSHAVVSENTESLVANSIARQALLPHLADSDSGTPAETVMGAAPSEGGDRAHAVARDLVTSASRQHADESRSATPHSHAVVSENTESLVANSIARQALLPHLADSDSGTPAETVMGAAPSEGGDRAHAVARDLVTSASRQHADESRSATPHSHAVISENTESIVANSIARQALLPHLADSDSGTPAETVMGAAPSEGGDRAHAVARDLVTSASRQHADENRSATPHSHAVISENTESIVANSIARQALLPHLADSDSGTPAETVMGAAPSEGGDRAHAVARDLVTSASRQHADESRSATPHSHAVVSENTESLVANSIARQALLPHLADSDSGTPAQTAGVEEVMGAAPSEGGDRAHAVARDLVTSASRQQADENPSATPHSHAVVSENTESLVANSIARQALLPHLAASDRGTPVETAGVEEVIGAAPSEIGDSAHAVARDLVNSASRQHADESRSATPHSHAVVSENTESLVANSIARQALLPHLADSDSGTPAQTAGVEEVMGAAPSEGGDRAHAVARDLVNSASRQQADERRSATPHSHAVISENTESIVANSIARQALLPHLADSDSGTPAQTAAVEEVIGAAPSEGGYSAAAIARDLVTSASRQQADDSEVYPASAPSVHDCEKPEGTARIVARDAADQLGRNVGQWQLGSPKNGFESMREAAQGQVHLEVIPPVSPKSPASAEERIVCHEVLHAHRESGRSLAAEAIASQEGACDASPASAAVLSEGSVDARYVARDAVHPFML
ncbi:avrBs3 [Symbiodinium sp. CCMP2592]|nr:avrBs3 [Symbiodinium sp. CCMP2592]